MKTKKIRKAVIPAAGLGTRFLPATKAQPKEMLPIVDKPAIQFIVEEAIASGIEEILIITGRNKRAIEDHFDRSIELEMQLKASGKYDLLHTIEAISNIEIHFIRQKETKGLGHAVLCAEHFIGDEPFAVLLGDDLVDANVPCLSQMIDVYRDFQTNLLGVQPVAQKDVHNYGIIFPKKIRPNIWQVTDLIEKPDISEAPSNLAVLGRYILEPEIFQILKETKAGVNQEIQLTDALRTLVKQQPMYAYQFQGRRYDIGDKEGFLEATVEQALKNPELRDRFLQYLTNFVKPIIQKEK